MARHRFRVVAALLVLGQVAGSCRTPPTPTVAPPEPGGGGLSYARSGLAWAGGEETEMRLTLSEGSEATVEPTRVPVAPSVPLTPQEVERVLGRLPPLEAPPGDQVDFRLPPQTLPAPRPGQTIDVPFPPPQAVEPGTLPAAGPLTVLRYSPEGDVELAPFLSVTFDQPMVALTSHADLAALDVPVKLSPLPEGSWHWVGTKTLMFEPVTRFPQATQYKVEIPAGTTSVTGGKLEESVTWTFTTPPPRMKAAYPTLGPTVQDPLVFVSFDQRIEPAAVLETIRLKAGGQVVPTVMAGQDEVEADETVKRMAKEGGEGRWLAFRPTGRLPYNTTVTVDIGPGTPSAEGPLTTGAVQSFGFSTFGPLQVVESRCGWDDVCRPLMPWIIRFSNPLDEDEFDESLVHIEPDLHLGKLYMYGDTLHIEGQSRGRTKYRVTLRAGITDRFGQTLGKDQTVTFDVGSAEPAMFTTGQTLVLLDPAARPTYSVFTINYGALRVRAYAVAPEDWPRYLKYLEQASRTEQPGEPPGRRVLDQTVPVESEADTLVQTPVDLSTVLTSGKGHVILVIEPERSLVEVLTQRGPRPVIRVWVQGTRIGLDAFADGRTLLAWANSLANGAPLQGVELTLHPGQVGGKTGTDGLARLNLGGGEGEGAYLVARLGGDTAVLPESPYWWQGQWGGGEPDAEYRWHVFDDRQMYRPGEEVHVKGWVRLVELIEAADVFSRPPAESAVRYQLVDSRGNELLAGSVSLNPFAGFDLAFTLPENMNLGYANLRLTVFGRSANGIEHVHALQVQEFRRPEFEVSVSVSQGPYFVLEHATATVEARYYAGGALPNAEVIWNVTSQPGSYRPPNWDDFIFGIWVPWWRFIEYSGYVQREPTRSESYPGTTDASGKHGLRIDFATVEPPQPTSVRAEATVMDVNRQAWAAGAQILVHPADLYVGLRTERTFYEQGKPIEVQAIVTDLDGNPVADRPIEVRAVRLEWTYERGQWKEEEVDEQRCTVGSADEPVSCTFQTPEGGTYRITATIVDRRGRRNLTQLTRWVSGGKQPSADRVEQEEATLVPDRKEYQPGDVAEVLVQSPFVPAEGLLTLRRGGLVRYERFRMEEGSYTLRVPIEEAYIPNLHVQVDLVGAAGRLDSEGRLDESLPSRPAFARGELDLSVPPYSRTLSLQVTPQVKELEPGGETWVHVGVKDASGAAVAGAEVALVVVDEAILALTGYEMADPVAAFYRSRAGAVSDYHLRGYILLAEPEALAGGAQLDRAAAAPAPMATMVAVEKQAIAEGEEVGQAIRLRTDFDPLAAFQPSVVTDADGYAALRVKVPDNLTRYRVMAVAAADDHFFGKGESAITARLPLMVRPSAPRFLNFGDKFELPIVLQNQTDGPMTVDVVVRATNVELMASAGQRLTVPPRDRREVRFPFATHSAGTARFQVGAVSGNWADAAEFSLPVYTPATTEAFAVYGTLDEGAIAQPVVRPSDAFRQFGALEISTSSTALQALSDAVLYLTSYPFECSEQLASRILGIAALRDVLSAFQAKGLPGPEELVSAVQRDIERLQGLQNADGGFPVWKQGLESWPFHSIHATHALIRARQKGFVVPDHMLARALAYVRQVEQKCAQWYGPEVRNTLLSYALYVRTLASDVDAARARKLIRDEGLDRLQAEAVGWLFYVLSGDAQSTAELSAIRRHLDNRVVETAGAANFSTSYREEDGYLLLASDRRADGVILEALMKDQPDSDLIAKLVRGLLAHRKAGRWSNTQENVFILLALDRYFNTYEAQTPEFVARVWLGSDYVAGFSFVGRTTEYQVVEVPMAFLAQRTGSENLILSKDGPGRLYYRLGLSYAPTSLDLEPMDEGFAVVRSYQAVDNPDDVRQDEAGVWHVRAGSRVRVRLTMVAPSRRYHVALVDPLPAGLEALNPALAVTGSIPQDPAEQQRGKYWWWRWTWYEHQNLRDQRAEAFASLLWEGIHTYTYVARATTPGEFVVPPPKAEEMYSPEVFGRGGTDRMVVE